MMADTREGAMQDLIAKHWPRRSKLGKYALKDSHFQDAAGHLDMVAMAVKRAIVDTMWAHLHEVCKNLVTASCLATSLEHRMPRSASCVQRITFRKPTVDDVVLPPAETVIECDGLIE